MMWTQTIILISVARAAISTSNQMLDFLPNQYLSYCLGSIHVFSKLVIHIYSKLHTIAITIRSWCSFVKGKHWGINFFFFFLIEKSFLINIKRDYMF